MHNQEDDDKDLDKQLIQKLNELFLNVKRSLPGTVLRDFLTQEKEQKESSISSPNLKQSLQTISQIERVAKNEHDLEALAKGSAFKSEVFINIIRSFVTGMTDHHVLLKKEGLQERLSIVQKVVSTVLEEQKQIYEAIQSLLFSEEEKSKFTLNIEQLKNDIDRVKATDFTVLKDRIVNIDVEIQQRALLVAQLIINCDRTKIDLMFKVNTLVHEKLAALSVHLSKNNQYQLLQKIGNLEQKTREYWRTWLAGGLNLDNIKKYKTEVIDQILEQELNQVDEYKSKDSAHFNKSSLITDDEKSKIEEEINPLDRQYVDWWVNTLQSQLEIVQKKCGEIMRNPFQDASPFRFSQDHQRKASTISIQAQEVLDQLNKIKNPFLTTSQKSDQLQGCKEKTGRCEKDLETLLQAILKKQKEENKTLQDRLNVLHDRLAPLSKNPLGDLALLYNQVNELPFKLKTMSFSAHKIMENAALLQGYSDQVKQHEQKADLLLSNTGVKKFNPFSNNRTFDSTSAIQQGLRGVSAGIQTEAQKKESKEPLSQLVKNEAKALDGNELKDQFIKQGMDTKAISLLLLQLKALHAVSTEARLVTIEPGQINQLLAITQADREQEQDESKKSKKEKQIDQLFAWQQAASDEPVPPQAWKALLQQQMQNSIDTFTSLLAEQKKLGTSFPSSSSAGQMALQTWNHDWQAFQKKTQAVSSLQNCLLQNIIDLVPSKFLVQFEKQQLEHLEPMLRDLDSKHGPIPIELFSGIFKHSGFKKQLPDLITQKEGLSDYIQLFDKKDESALNIEAILGSALLLRNKFIHFDDSWEEKVIPRGESYQNIIIEECGPAQEEQTEQLGLLELSSNFTDWKNQTQANVYTKSKLRVNQGLIETIEGVVQDSSSNSCAYKMTVTKLPEEWAKKKVAYQKQKDSELERSSNQKNEWKLPSQELVECATKILLDFVSKVDPTERIHINHARDPALVQAIFGVAAVLGLSNRIENHTAHQKANQLKQRKIGWMGRWTSTEMDSSMKTKLKELFEKCIDKFHDTGLKEAVQNFQKQDQLYKEKYCQGMSGIKLKQPLVSLQAEESNQEKIAASEKSKRPMG